MKRATTTTFDSSAWALLLAAGLPELRADGRVRDLLNSLVDWESVLRLADQHGVASLLHQNLLRLGDSVPSDVLTSLKQKCERNIHKALFLTRELMQVLDCAREIGVELIPYKGVVLSEVYYGDMALRPGGDLDLFVRVGDVARLKSALSKLGYSSRVAIPEAAEADYLASGYEWTFDSPAGKNLLELQWALQPRFYAVDFDMNGLFARAEKVVFAGRVVKTLSAEDALIVLSLHAAKHVWGRLIWLCDIAQILRRELNWDWISALARGLGIERILHITLLLGNRLLRTEIPSAVLGEVQDDRAAHEFAERIAASIAAGVMYEEEKITYFRMMMELRERRWDRVRFFTRLAFTPGPGEWAAIRLPRALFPVYRVVRLGRLAERLLRG